MDHGGNRKHKIVGRRQGQEEESSNRSDSEQRKQEIRTGSENDGPCQAMAAQGRQALDRILEITGTVTAHRMGGTQQRRLQEQQKPRQGLADDPELVTLSPVSRCGR